MKKVFTAIAVIATLSCNTGRHIEIRTTSKNNDNIFANMKKVQCTMDIEKRIGRQLSVH